ncbi:hypothetical protein BDN67DRAFT_915528, partial [Paxillus ammoniavirescens]
LSHDTIQKYMSDFFSHAGLAGNFTTHCFRHGGAQYRFMFSPLGERWPLTIIHWWGGWAVGEHYLLDELAFYENDHCDALCPIPCEANLSFNGDQVLTSLVTAQELWEMVQSIDRKLEHQSMKVEGKLQVACTVFVQTLAAMVHSGSGHLTPVSPSVILIPNIGRGPDAWQTAVQQWEEVDNQTGYALHDWPTAWYTGKNKAKFAAKWGQCQIIAEEYSRCVHSSTWTRIALGRDADLSHRSFRLGQDDSAFIAKYPQAQKVFSATYEAVRSARVCRGETQ